MSPMPAALVLGLTAAACSGPEMPDVPTAPSAVESVVSGSGAARTEQWRLDLTIREVFGIECGHQDIGQTREVDLQMSFSDDGTVSMRYGLPQRMSPDAAEVSGWTLDGGFEGSGVAYEGLPCSGRALELAGAPTTLTGYFNDDRSTFTGVEVRRYLNRPGGDIVYHVEWSATRL